MPWIQVNPVVDVSVRGLCRREYYNHPKGCPNWGKKAHCPPHEPLVTKLIDITKPVWAIFNVFDLAAHISKMRNKHPNWSDHQLRCCLYWQPTARRSLRQIIHQFLACTPNLVIIPCPEAAGVNLTATMMSAGIKLEWPPTIKAYQIVLAGTKI